MLFQSPGQLAFLGLGREARGRYCYQLELVTCRIGVAYQVGAVEQDPRACRIWCVAHLATRAHDLILAHGDDVHLARRW